MKLLILFILIAFNSLSQIGMGEWRLHTVTSNAIDVAAFNDRVFVAFSNGLSEYEYSSKEIFDWTAVNSLSDITITSLGVSTQTNSLFIGYDNGNVDHIRLNNLTNIPAIKLASVQGSKRINKIVEHNGYMYFATGFSIVKIDPVKNEVKDTYYPTNGNEAIIDIAFKNDSIFALTEQLMYSGVISNVALADPSQWAVDTRVPLLTVSSESYAEIEAVGDSLYILYKGLGFGLDTLFKVQNDGLAPAINEAGSVEINSIKEINGKLAVNYFPGTFLFDLDFVTSEWFGLYSFGGAPNLNTLSYNNGTYWLADKDIGLVKHQGIGNNSPITINGLPKSDIYRMTWLDNKLLIASGGLVFNTPTYRKSGVYIFEDEKWSVKSSGNMSLWDDSRIWDYLSVSVNPTDKNEFATSSYSNIPLSIGRLDGQITDTFNIVNSNIENTSPGGAYPMLTHVQYDEEGNLWMLNAYTQNPLKVYTKEKTWHKFSASPTDFNFTMAFAIDYNGNKWYSVRNAGLFGYNNSNTISNSSDDKKLQLTSGEFSGNLPSNTVTAIAVDFDNEIWIGTDNGFAVLYNSEGAFDASAGGYNAQRIKIDFEGNVEYVLGNTSITDIIVDGANRKWFATENSGLILLSADGLEVLEQHTVDNSPLISNAIIDLELDQTTGELFILTDKGLISYRTDASYEDPEYSNVIVFPNPARPEFDGPITIQGIRYNSDVKITDIAGKLVYKTTSNGGTATWDGKTLNGDKVATGVYLIWTAANEGKGRKVGKVLVVN